MAVHTGSGRLAGCLRIDFEGSRRPWRGLDEIVPQQLTQGLEREQAQWPQNTSKPEIRRSCGIRRMVTSSFESSQHSQGKRQPTKETEARDWLDLAIMANLDA